MSVPSVKLAPGMESKGFTRRDSLLRLGGLAIAATHAGGWAAADDAEGSAALSQGLVSCVLTPELTEGPFYVSGEKLRRDVTEGKPGVALTLKLKVLHASTCRPIRNATVEIWHCDALGAYSGAVASNPDTNFLRGAQKTNAKGVATFETIYPGWYQGRAVHVHVKVHVRGRVVHTGQFFFPAKVTNAVYKQSPYRKHGTRPDTTNAQDFIFRNGGRKSMLSLEKVRNGFIGRIAMGVHA